MKLILQKNANFSSAGGSAPDPRVSGGWGLGPQTPISLLRQGAPLSDPQNSPQSRISGSAPMPGNIIFESLVIMLSIMAFEFSVTRVYFILYSTAIFFPKINDEQRKLKY